jgi:chromosome segregation ATPase
LKDIPVLGVLFSSKDVEEKGIEVIFILTPSISSGGVKYADMLEGVRDRLAGPTYDRQLQDVLTDPLGTDAYTEHVEEQAARAEFEKIKAEIEQAEARGEVELVKEKLYQTAEDVLAEKSKAAQSKAQMAAISGEIEKLKAEAAAGKAQLDELQKKLDQTEAEKAAAEQQNQEQLEALQKSQEQLQAEAAQVKKEAEEAKKRLAELEKAQAEAEQEAESVPSEGEGQVQPESQGEENPNGASDTENTD